MNVSPVEVGIYLQDKLEFQGMIANVGLRGDILLLIKMHIFVELPFDEDLPISIIWCINICRRTGLLGTLGEISGIA
jgi:hypothetical protein